jgi:hypothetical protein
MNWGKWRFLAPLVQAIGLLKTLAPGDLATSAAPSRRFLIVTGPKDASQVVLRQDNSSNR